MSKGGGGGYAGPVRRPGTPETRSGRRGLTPSESRAASTDAALDRVERAAGWAESTAKHIGDGHSWAADEIVWDWEDLANKLSALGAALSAEGLR